MTMDSVLNSTQADEELQKLTAALQAAMPVFASLSLENRRKLLQSLATIFDVQDASRASSPEIRTVLTPFTAGTDRGGHFSEDRSMSPKEFMLQKQPRTDVERVACLAYSLRTTAICLSSRLWILAN